MIEGSAAGLTAIGAQFWTQQSPGILGAANRTTSSAPRCRASSRTSEPAVGLHRSVDGVFRRRPRPVDTPATLSGQVTCPACSTLNDAEQRFCTACGASLARECGVCGTVNALNARFCGACGSPLETPSSQPPGVLAEERKVVSVLFADLAGFTASSDGADPEDVKARLRPYFARAREEIESVGGTVEKFIGDAVVGLFGAPTSREDDPVRAVQAAWQVARAIDELNEQDASLELAIQVGVDTGEVVVDVDSDVGRGETIATGE